MEQVSSIVENATDDIVQYGELYDDYPIFTAHDSDLNLPGSGLYSGTSTSGSLSELDLSLPSTDLDLETRIFGKVKKAGQTGVPQKRNSLGPSGSFVQEPRTTGRASRRSLRMGESDPEDHVFHPEIVPFEPSKNPVTNNSKDPRNLLESKAENKSAKSDPNSARYLKILIPQRDLPTAEGPSVETSVNLFESLNISAAERLLLESPTDSPSHFKQAQLCLDPADSEVEGSFVGQDRDNTFLSSTPRKQDFTPYPNQAFQKSGSRSSQDIKTEIFDFEAELKRLVVEIYSDKEPDFAPVPGSLSSREGIHSTDPKMSQARTELEKAFGGGDEFITPYEKTQDTPKMSEDTISHLANASDAMALQKSVVSDSSVKPASMDEIAAILASVKQGAYQRDQSLSSVNTTLQSSYNNNLSIDDDDTPNEKVHSYNSMSSLDETPSKIPADYVEPEVTPTEVNGIDPSREPAHVHTGKEGENTSSGGDAAPNHLEGPHQPETQEKKVVTTKKRPTSLLAQNTTLAISSAIAHKYKVPPPDEALSPTSMVAPKEPRLFRSPVVAITTAKGGMIATMEGLEKTKPKKKKSKKGTKKNALSTRIMSDTDTEPPSDTELMAQRQAENDSRITPTPSEDSLSAKDQVATSKPSPSSQDNQQNQQEEKEPTRESQKVPPAESQVIPNEQQTVATSAPENTHVPEQVPASPPDPAPTQPTSEPSSGSFLGSLFPWGRRSADKPAAPVNEKVTDVVSSANQNAASPPSTNHGEPSRDGAKNVSSLDSDVHSDSVDSGVGFVGGVNGDLGTPTAHVQTPQPISSSTPTSTNIRIERSNENIPRQETPQFNQAAPTVDHLQKASCSMQSRLPAPSLVTSKARPIDLGRLKSTPLPRASTYQTSRYSSPFEDQGAEDELQTVLREKAKLEGQLEMLTAETESALQARTQLQSQVAILQAKLKAQGSGGDSLSHNRSALEADIRSLKQNKFDLEQAIAQLQVELEHKEADLEGLRRELHTSEATTQRLRSKLEDVKREIAGKDASVSQLQDKMAAMQGQVDQARQDQTMAGAKLSSLQTDVESLTKARDWFQEQLGFAQETRNQLQGELAASQMAVASQSATIENLRTDNTKVKQQLNEERQRMLQEKELIAKNLETIEADIFTREATFSAMQREKTAVQQAVFAQMDQMEEEKYRLAGLVASASELERQLEVARQELEAKHAALVNLEAEKRELVKGVALAEEALAARETEMQALQIKCNNVEQKLKEEQGKSTGQDGEVRQLRADKASLEVALASANEEKRAFDESLQKLRGDLGRVETGFKQMRQDLGAKTSELEAAQMEGQQLKEQLKVQEQQVETQEANLEASIAAIGNKDAIIDELLEAKGKLEKEIEGLRRDMQSTRNFQESSAQANAGLQVELSKAREGFQMLENQLQNALEENANLHGQLESLTEDQKQLEGLMDENASLRQRAADTQSSMHRDLAEQKANVLRLGTDLSNVQKELRERERAYEDRMAALTSQLQDTSVAKDQVERELNERTAAVAQLSKEEQNKLLNELQGVKQDADVLRSEKNRLNDEVQHLRRNMEDDTEAYRRRIDDLEAELQELKDILDRQRRNELNNRALALDLERERGRLAGVHQSHSALKQHTGMLESALAQRESAVAELSAELTSTAQERANENLRLQKLVREMGAALEKEKQATQEVKKQLSGEKGQCNRLRQDLETLQGDAQENRSEAKQKEDQMNALQSELARLRQNEEKQRKEGEEMRRQIESNKNHMDRLKRHLQDKDAQSPVLEDQMKTLAWQSEQKSREAEALKEQLLLAEKRQQIELDGVKTNLQMTNKELDGMKKELASTRKEKFAFQAKLSQLKSALQATLQQNKLLKAKLKSKSRVASTMGKPGPDGASQGDGKGQADEIVVPEIAYDVESLLNSDVVEGVSASHSRPLHAIQSCLQSIKDQMGALEDQMKEHTAAVNTSSEAWKEVGDRVRDLRKASADPVTPTPGLLPRSLPNGSVTGTAAPPQQRMSNGKSSGSPIYEL
nr:golgin subfamily A member 3-like [Lytechinus pictus]